MQTRAEVPSSKWISAREPECRAITRPRWPRVARPLERTLSPIAMSQMERRLVIGWVAVMVVLGEVFNNGFEIGFDAFQIVDVCPFQAFGFRLGDVIHVLGDRGQMGHDDGMLCCVG